MLNYIVKRILLMIPTLFAITLIVFVLVNIAPGMPGQSQMANATEDAKGSANARESYRLFKQQYQLDKPILFNTRWRITTEDVAEELEVVADASQQQTAAEELRNHVAEQSAVWVGRILAAPRVALEAQLEDPTLPQEERETIQKRLQEMPSAQVPMPLPPRPPQRQLIRAQNHLEDWGQQIVPELIQIATRYVNVRGAEGQHVRLWLDEQEAQWRALLANQHIDVDGRSYRLDAARTFKVRQAATARLSINARRQILVTEGSDNTAERRAQNQEISKENHEIAAWTYPLDAPQESRVRTVKKWDDWYAEHAYARYKRTTGHNIAQTFLDTRFSHYMGNLIPFSWSPTPHIRAPRLGMSLRYRQPVMDVIAAHWQYSIAMSLISLLLAYCIAVPIGVVAAVRHNGPIADRGVGIFLFILYSFPVFFGATLLQTWLTPARGLDWFPVSGFDDGHPLQHTSLGYGWVLITHMVLPIVCLTYPSLAALSRYARSGLLDVIRADYIRTARAKGLPEWMVVIKHAVRNGMIPIITLLGSTLPVVLGGSIVIEYIFAIDGMGALMLQSIGQRDYNVILGVLLLSSVLTLAGILLSDIAYALVDPRISYD